MKEISVEKTSTKDGRPASIHTFWAVSVDDRDLIRGQALDYFLGQPFPTKVLKTFLSELRTFRASLENQKTSGSALIPLMEDPINYVFIKESGRTWEHLRNEDGKEAMILFVNGRNFIGKATLELTDVKPANG